MRRAAVVGLALLFAPLARAAEPVAFRGVVVTDEAKLRGGPSDNFPETGTLTRGTAVVVEREEPNGWLAVTAPKGSVSWVAAAFVEDLAPEKPTPKLAMVHSEGEVTVASGKPGLAQPLDVRREKLPQGTMVMLIGPKVDFNGKKWYPIEPPAGDVRYLPKTAVQYDRPANTNAFSVRINENVSPLPVVPASGSGSGTPGASLPGPARVQPDSGTPVVNHDLWIRAEAAERAGRTTEAERLYFELAGLMNREGGDNTIANLCYTRIHSLREKNRAASTPTGGTTSSAKDDRGVRPGAPQAVPPSERPTRPAPDAGTAVEARPQWSGGGTLRRSAITPNGKTAYALETSPGVVKWYVTAGAGVDLERWLGKRVEVYGTPAKVDGLSKPLAAAVAVEPLQ
jgi:hypothetical protein